MVEIDLTTDDLKRILQLLGKLFKDNEIPKVDEKLIRKLEVIHDEYIKIDKEESDE